MNQFRIVEDKTHDFCGNRFFFSSTGNYHVETGKNQTQNVDTRLENTVV